MQPTSAEAPEWVGFGYGELAYLLGQIANPSSKKAADLINLAEEEISDSAMRAGVSSLAARGLLVPADDGTVVPDGAASLLTYVIVEGVHWTEIGFMSTRDEVADGAILIQAPAFTVLLQPRNFGVWVMVAKDPVIAAAEAVFALIDSFVAAHPGGATFIHAQTLDADATLFVRRVDHGLWEIARGASVAGDESKEDSVDPDAVLGALRRILDVGAPNG